MNEKCKAGIEHHQLVSVQRSFVSSFSDRPDPRIMKKSLIPGFLKKLIN